MPPGSWLRAGFRMAVHRALASADTCRSQWQLRQDPGHLILLTCYRSVLRATNGRLP